VGADVRVVYDAMQALDVVGAAGIHVALVTYGMPTNSWRSIRYAVHRWLLRRPYLLADASVGGLRFWVKTEDAIGRHLYKDGWLEKECTRALLRVLALRTGDVVIDVGANIGWYALVIDRSAPPGVDIYAFEPDPGNFDLATRNIALNGARGVHLVECALSDSAGTRTLYRYPDKNRGRHSLLPIHAGDQISIETTTLDLFWAEAGLGDRVPRFIKIDIEGYELFALKGARRVLEQCPMVLLEYSPRYMRAAGIDPAALPELMAAAGFIPHEFLGAETVPVNLASIRANEAQRNLLWMRSS
jgi:FkbM family methyltransferase